MQADADHELKESSHLSKHPPDRIVVSHVDADARALDVELGPAGVAELCSFWTLVNNAVVELAVREDRAGVPDAVALEKGKEERGGRSGETTTTSTSVCVKKRRSGERELEWNKLIITNNNNSNSNINVNSRLLTGPLDVSSVVSILLRKCAAS